MNNNKRSTSVNTRNQIKSKRTPNLSSPTVHKEAFTSLDDEVTKLSWSKILQRRTAYAQANFMDACDPLRSLHFLIEQFCSKIQGHVNVTNGNGVPNTDLDRMLSNIREIMVRIPQNLNFADSKGVCLVCHKLRTKYEHKFSQTGDGKLKPRIKTLNRQVQTVSHGKRANTAITQVNLFERQFESKVKVIEEKHKFLEDEIVQLKNENQRLQNVLIKEREELNHLRAEITINEKDYQEEKSKFLKEIYSLASQIKNMKEFEQKLHEMEDLKKQLYELRYRNKILERELDKANKETIQSQLKYEKMCEIIENREKQLVKLHQEFLNVQKLVNSNNHLEQIMQTSSPSNNHEGIISDSWGLISNIQTYDNSINSNLMETTSGSNRTPKKRDRQKSEETITVCNNSIKFVQLPSDISTTSSQVTNYLSDVYLDRKQK